MIPNKNSEWMQRMMLTYAQTVGEAALDDTDNAAEVPTELDQLCKALIRYAPEKKPRKKRMLRPAALAAAVLAALLVGMIAVQAAGVNLFGVRARWNDDILNITPGGKDNGAPSDRPASQGSVLDAVLTEQDLPLTLGPSKIPAGYSLSELKVSDTDDLKNVFACYTGENGSLSVSILQIHGKGNYFVEKDAEAPEMYTTKGGRTFLLLHNVESWTGAWSDGEYVVILGGFETRKQLIQTIDSMEEN